MPFDFTSICISIGLALAGGIWLGHFVAARAGARLHGWYFVLWFCALMPLGPPYGKWGALAATVTGALHGLPLVAVFAAAGFHALREHHNAARSLGAGEWRIFWRVLAPNAWRYVLNGVLLASARLVAERYIAANL